MAAIDIIKKNNENHINYAYCRYHHDDDNNNKTVGKIVNLFLLLMKKRDNSY